jgi:large subunit ribosomal protein L32
MRRSHQKMSVATLSIDETTGELHRRHHVTKDRFYRGREVSSKSK